MIEGGRTGISRTMDREERPVGTMPDRAKRRPGTASVEESSSCVPIVRQKVSDIPQSSCCPTPWRPLN
jgi:hypothetical protein